MSFIENKVERRIEVDRLVRRYGTFNAELLPLFLSDMSGGLTGECVQPKWKINGRSSHRDVAETRRIYTVVHRKQSGKEN